MAQFTINTKAKYFSASGLERRNLSNGGGGTLYYSKSETVSAVSNEGNLVAGETLEMTYGLWLISASQTGIEIFDAVPEPGGGEGVIGPGKSVNTDLAIFNGTTGKRIKDSGVLLSSVALDSEVAAKTPVDTVFNFPMIAGDEVSAEVAKQNTEILQEALDTAAAEGRDCLIGGQTYRLYGDVACPSNVRVFSAVKGLAVLKSHPEYPSNGPLFHNPISESGDVIPVKNFTFENLIIDGDYEANAEFNTQVTLASEVTPASTKFVFTEDITKILTPEGTLLLVEYSGDNVGEVTYTGIEGLHTITGVKFVEKSNSAPFTANAGTLMRQFNDTTVGGIRFYTYENLQAVNCDFKNFGSYCVGLQGQPEEEETRPDKVKPKVNATFRNCTFSGSYNSDGIDIKEQERILFDHCDAFDNHDKGFNPRGPYQTYIACRTWGNGTGYSLTTNRLHNPEPYGLLLAEATVSATEIEIEVPSAAAAIESNKSGYLGAERVSWGTVESLGSGKYKVKTLVRAKEGSKPAFHKKNSEESPSLLVQDVEGASALDGTVAMFDSWSLGDIGTGIAILAAGAGTTMRVEIHGGGAKGSNRGLILNAVRGQIIANIHGGNYYANGEGVRGINLKMLKMFGTRANTNSTSEHPNGTGNGIALVNCTNGAELVGVDAKNNGAYGLVLLNGGSTDYVKVRGGDYSGNTTGALSGPPQKIAHNFGQIFRAGNEKTGFYVPSNGASAANQSAAMSEKQAKGLRFIGPYDCTITKIGYIVTAAATSNDSVDVGIYDQNFKLLSSSGSTAGKLNAEGTKVVSLGSTVQLYEGGVYFVVLVTGAPGGTAAKLRLLSSDTELQTLCGTSSNLEAIAMSNAFPLAEKAETFAPSGATPSAPILACIF